MNSKKLIIMLNKEFNCSRGESTALTICLVITALFQCRKGNIIWSFYLLEDPDTYLLKYCEYSIFYLSYKNNSDSKIQ